MAMIGSDVTDGDGNYFVDGLVPGMYYVSIPTPDPNFEVSSTDVATTDDTNNDVDGDDNGLQTDGAGAGVWSNPIELLGDSEPVLEPGSGGNQDGADDDNGNMTVDFGFVPYLSLGSTVFADNNNNGIQDPEDNGIPGVTIEVFNLGPDGIAENGDDPGSSDPTTDDPEDNEDGDDNGIQNAFGEGVWSGVITLEGDDEPTGEPGSGGDQDAADDDNGNMTIDFGFRPSVDVSLIKVVDNPEPNVGETVTFTITLSNDGPNDATGVAVEDVVPNGFSDISNISNGGGADANSIITWSDIDIPVGGSVDLTFDVTVEAPLDGVEYDNVAEVVATDQFDEDSTPGNGPDPDGDGLIGPEDNNPNDGSVDPDPASGDSDEDDDADNEPVEPQVADISLIKTVSNPEPNVGEVITFTIEVSNAGPNDATNVAIEDAVPNGFSDITNISTGGTEASSIITWSELTIPAGGSEVLTFDVTVEPPVDGAIYENIADVTASDQFDPDSEPGNGPDSDGDGLIGTEDDNPMSLK